MSETSIVRRTIRSRETSLWWDAQGNWTADFDQARCFPGIVEAMQAVEQATLKKVQFVIRLLPSTQPDFVVNLPDSDGARDKGIDYAKTI